MDPIPSETGSTVEGPMEQTTLDSGKQFATDMADGQDVDSVFVVRECSRRQKRNGDSFLKLRLGDVSGAFEAVVWDGVEQVAEAARAGEVVRVAGRFAVDSRYGASLTVRALRIAAREEYAPVDLVESSPLALDQMERDLDELLEIVKQPHLRRLLDRLIGRDSELGARWREAPAAKHYHQAYRHGLFEHCLSVANGVAATAAMFPGIDRELAVTGALLHDVGKVEAYAEENGSIELTDAGKLHGEIPLGYFLVRSEIEGIDGFPPELAQAVLHIILSHHGKLEHGSPVVPCTREATLVHMIDNLGGTLGSFDRLEKTLQDGEQWSAFDRGISSSAYFARQMAGAAREEAA
jgi:3'-5' exoribonuclease